MAKKPNQIIAETTLKVKLYNFYSKACLISSRNFWSRGLVGLDEPTFRFAIFFKIMVQSRPLFPFIFVFPMRHNLNSNLK